MEQGHRKLRGILFPKEGQRTSCRSETEKGKLKDGRDWEFCSVKRTGSNEKGLHARNWIIFSRGGGMCT